MTTIAREKLLLRGSFNIQHSGSLTEAVQFMFNPATVTRGHGWNHGSNPIPGRSHPKYGGGAGTDEPFSFLLQLDASRGYFTRRMGRNSQANTIEHFFGGPPSNVNETEDLRPLIDHLMQFTYPEDSAGRGTNRYGVPQRVWVSLGSALNGECQIDFMEEHSFFYSNSMKILKAELNVEGHMIFHQNISNRVLLARYTGGGDLPNTVSNSANTYLPSLEDLGPGFGEFF